MKVVRFRDLAPRPWKNGSGVARVIAQHPGGSADTTFDWYVGIADIDQSGPFSAYPGMDRRLIQLQGPPISIRCRSIPQAIDFTQRISAPLVEFAFQGDWETTCELLPQPLQSPSEPIRVLNVIARRERVSAKVEVVSITDTTALEKAPTEHLVLLLGGGTARAMAGGAAHPPLARLDAVVAGEPGYASISVSRVGFDESKLLAIRIAPIA